MNVVLFMADGRQYDVQVVNDGDSVRMPTLSKSGYTFTGWRVNNSNTIVRGGESYPITANTTFTAVWNMIMIPDTYDIAVDQPAHGTVDVSFSNASQGSVITVTATPDEGYELVYITVDGEPISGSSFVMPGHAVEVSAVFAEIGKEVNFVDVSRADWFYDYVQYVAQNGLMEGTTRTAFEPNASMTRAMFWTVLARIDGETITGDAWKTLAQTWAVESGISDGTNADALITREQMVTMLYRYAGSPVAGGMAISEFTDGASVSGYATDAVTWALSEGILTGMGDGILAPQGTATRAQAAAMLMRFVEA
ncbi:MAG TPA: S-layer homology domain-containing protein [Candidatus Scatomorpha stercorigallinarum]|nr:S-layer homology domain-containing protein [Candidatus Scatomorpha stercorigallinarum]